MDPNRVIPCVRQANAEMTEAAQHPLLIVIDPNGLRSVFEYNQHTNSTEYGTN